jgi:hypothetical protein
MLERRQSAFARFKKEEVIGMREFIFFKVFLS